MKICLKIYLMFFLCLSAIGAGAQVVYVKHDATGANDGSSWSNAYTDLHTAITGAPTSATIWVARGIYKPTQTIPLTSGVPQDRDKTFLLDKTIRL